MKIVLIADAPVWHKLWSVRFAVFSAIFGGLSAIYMDPTTPPEWLPKLPIAVEHLLGFISITLAVSSPVARIIAQANIPSAQPRIITVPPSQPPGEDQTIVVPPLTLQDVKNG